MYLFIKKHWVGIVLAIVIIALLFLCNIDVIEAIADGWNPSIAVAVLSVFVAGCALGVTFWQGWQNDRHNRLSVRPLLKFDVTAGAGHGRRLYKLKLTNYGVGPAIIKDIKLFSDGELVPLEKNKSIIPFILEIIKNLDSEGARGIMLEDVLVAGGEITLLDVQCDTQNQNINGVLKMGLLVRYESLYKEKFPLLQHGKISDENPT